jgi:hypothetical protein
LHQCKESQLLQAMASEHVDSIIRKVRRGVLWEARELMSACGRKQPLVSPDIRSGECPLLPNTSHSDASI